MSEEYLNAALDENPGDAFTRGVLADFYEEGGRPDRAEEERYLIAAGKWPRARKWEGDRFPVWDWWFFEDEEDADADPAYVTREAWLHLRDAGVYDTRREAEADYLAHCRRAGLLISEGVPVGSTSATN